MKRKPSVKQLQQMEAGPEKVYLLHFGKWWSMDVEDWGRFLADSTTGNRLGPIDLDDYGVKLQGKPKTVCGYPRTYWREDAGLVFEEPWGWLNNDWRDAIEISKIESNV